MATLHKALRIYVLGCSYNSSSWLDNPANLISDLESALSGITDLNSYNRLLVSNKRNASDKVVEIEIDGIIYLNKSELTTGEADSLISDFDTAMSGITNLSYTDINMDSEVFREDPTTGWPGTFEKE